LIDDIHMVDILSTIYIINGDVSLRSEINLQLKHKTVTNCQNKYDVCMNKMQFEDLVDEDNSTHFNPDVIV
jgi:hypothetical protein